MKQQLTTLLTQMLFVNSNVHLSTLDDSNLQASTSESLGAVAASETPEPIPSTSTPAYRYI